MSESPVLFAVVPCAGGRSLGIATLNSEKTLNSLSLPMIDLIMPQLQIWRDDPSIVLVMFQSRGERAFSAGGDIQELYESMQAHPGGPNPYADAFFEREYRLDYLIHTYPKPVLVWAHGFVMGGGLGVMAAASHRIGTEQSRIAMPEITIGLFPDAGATWFLAHMPAHLAFFLAWTGSHLNAVDARRVGLIDCLIKFADKAQVLEVLQREPWSDENDDNHRRLDGILAGFQSDADEFPASVLLLHEDWIKRVINTSFRSDNPALAFSEQMQELGPLGAGDKWLERAATNFRAGSPTTARMIPEQIQRARGLTLKQIFMLEFAIAIQCSRHSDFVEGIRALLIDKDNKPNWQYGDISAVPAEYVAAHFELPAGMVNPLSDLKE